MLCNLMDYCNRVYTCWLGAFWFCILIVFFLFWFLIDQLILGIEGRIEYISRKRN